MKKYSVDFFNNIEVVKLGIRDYKINCLEASDANWDVFFERSNNKNIPNNIFDRNPELDICENSIVGIDFGTKSTVAIIMENDETYIPIKLGNISGITYKGDKEYENPTILLFKNYNKFLNDYSEKNGRPYTDINDLLTSWFANNSDNKDIYNSFSKLKQWTTTNTGYRNIYDNNKKEIKLYNFQEKEKGDVDPIELYAYYLGSFINSFKKRKIYLKYLLTFPVTFSENVKKSVIDSFRKGIIKSLPEFVINNPNRLKIDYFCTEPQGYAITAFEKFGIKPDEENEKIIYTVYDFGGGTTDFDYGILMKNDKYSDYQYLLDSKYTYGDATLGGENIIEDLVGAVVEFNINILRENKIQIQHSNRYKKRIENEDVLLEENIGNRYSNYNTQKLMRCIRIIWENQKEGVGEIEEWINSINSNSIVMFQLYNEDGNMLDIPLKIDKKLILKEIRKKVRQGIKKFLKGYIKFLDILMKENTCNNKCKKYIFLSGNATKSEIFIEEMELIFNKLNNNNNNIYLYYPLGTEKANEQIIIKQSTTEFEPNLKTGVVYGMLQTQKSDYPYKVEKSNYINFKFILKHRGNKLNGELNKFNWVLVGKFIEGEIRLKYKYLNTDIYENLVIDNYNFSESNPGYLYIKINSEDSFFYSIVDSLTNDEKVLENNIVEEKKIKYKG